MSGPIPRKAPFLPVLALVAALVLAACGSTAPVSERAAVATEDGLVVTEDGQIVNAEGEVVGETGRLAGSGSAVSGGSARSAGGAGTSGATGSVSGSSATGGTSAAKPGATAPGVSATEVKLGIIYDRSAGYTNAALGYSGVGQLDRKRSYDALIADINKRGGIAGRKLVPVYHVVDSAGPDANTPTEVMEQRYCTTFRENRVFATFYAGEETFTRCMNDLGVVRITTAAVDSKLLEESPLLISLNVSLDRSARFTTARLGERGFYREGKDGAKPVKIGLVRYDDPEYERAAAALKAELAKQGLSLAGEAAIRQAETLDQVQDETNSIRAAALQFKSDGITNVQFISPGNAYLELIFMQNAEKQLYRPRYGLNSASGGMALAVLLGSDAQSQLSQSLQVGWFPIFDVERASYSGDKTTKAFQHCIKVLQEAGESFSEGDPTRNKEAQAAIFCDQFNYLQAAGNAAGLNLTPQTFTQRGVPSVTDLESAATYVLSTAKRRDAYSAVRYARWLDDCQCYRFESNQLYPV